MGSENSKRNDQGESQRNQTNREIRQRLSTEDDIHRALENQKKMFEAKQLKMQTSSGIYPNIHMENLNTINSPITSNEVHYIASPSAPPEDVLFSQRNTTVSRQTYQQTSPSQTPTPFQSSATPSSASLSYITPSSAGPPYITPSSARPVHAASSSAGPSHTTQSPSRPSHAAASSAGPSHITPSSARPSHAAASSAGPSHTTQSPSRPSHAAASSAGPSHITPSSARPSHAAASSAGPSHITPSSARPSHAAASSAGPSHITPSSARPSHAAASSAGPSHITPSSARPSHAAASSAGPSHITPSSARPSHAAASSAGPSHITPSFARSSHATPTAAGPHKRNHNRNPARRTRSISRVNQNNRELNGLVNCVTCNGQLGLHIYQCINGHSSCDGCKFKMARCGNCTEPITDMRNITLESTLADLTINTEERIKCPNAKDGCRLHFKREELQNHLKECPFNIISCPVMEFCGDCSWKGTIKQLSVHFNEAHPKHLEADVNKEMHIIVMELDYKVMHLVNIGFHKFLVHIQLDTSLNNIYMVAQYLGTSFGASKWTYEWHVYNKKEPRRKFEYIDVCKSNATSVSEIVNNNDCAVINIDYAKTFLDSGKLTFKFYLKKQFDNKNNIDTTSN